MESSAPVLCVCIFYFYFLFLFWSRNGILCARPVCLYECGCLSVRVCLCVCIRVHTRIYIYIIPTNSYAHTSTYPLRAS